MGRRLSKEADREEIRFMNLLLIGGVERRELDLSQIAARAGYRLAYHSGDVGGRGAIGLRSLIERADVVLFQTAINSHGSMYLAKRWTRQLGKEFVVIRKCGPARLETLLADRGRAAASRRAQNPTSTRSPTPN
jgi:hypothetical protein